VKPAVALNLTLEAVKQIAFELRDLAAAQACHMNVVALRAAFVIMLFPLHVHKIEFVNETVALEQVQRAINGNAIYTWIEPPRVPQDLRRIQVLLGSFDDAEDGSPLMRHAQPTRHQLSL
jgi:hypothetical protein